MSLNEVRDAADEADGEPRQADHQKALAGEDVGLGVEPLEADTDANCHEDGDHERQDRLAVDERRHERDQQGDREVLEDAPHEAEAGPVVDTKPHCTPPSMRYTPRGLPSGSSTC